jgi:hypothetical protein
MDPAIDYAYAYRAPSRLDAGPHPTLRLATAGGAVANPRLFRGRVLQPVLFADALLAVGAVARSRFHVPPAMLARILLLADPVATAAHDRLRFEAFSSCASVYARLDLLPGFVDGTFLGTGTTNVDLGAQVRAALAGVTADAALDLELGADDLAVEIDGARHEERRVALPQRWVRGFAETQAILASMTPGFAVDGAAFRRFLRDLPRGAKDPVFVTEAGGALVLSRRPVAGAVSLGDADRLRVVERLAPAVRSVAVFASADGSSGWCFQLAESRMTVAISPAAWRGFSGEGRVAETLGRAPERRIRAGVLTALAWRAEVRPADLADELAADPAEVAASLAALAAAGRVGFDLADGGYFGRELPFTGTGGERLQPRLRKARALVAAGAVRFEATGLSGSLVAWVAGRSTEYRVRIGADGRACTCPWWGKHPGDRGPCAHVLAAELAAAGSDEVALGRAT